MMIPPPQQFQSNIPFTKLYVGQLPLSIQQANLREVFSQLSDIKQLKVIKGNSQGQFDRYCYAFMTIRGDQETAAAIIKKVSLEYPQWKMNIRPDNNDRNVGSKPIYQNRGYPNQGNSQMPSQQFQQPYMYGMQSNEMQRYPQQNVQSFYPPMQGVNYPIMQSYQQQGQQQQRYQTQQLQQNIDTSEKIYGEKNLKIMVRQIWLGGIPEMCQQSYMAQLMGQFGIVDNMQIFPKFAFIRFKLAQQATVAFERAQRMYQMFGTPPGFRIFFSDPARRANIVSNHYEFDRQSPFIPVLFLGFPPVTSANVDLDHMRQICERYGTIVSYYMKKNNNSQTRSYILFTYDNIKSALKAKIQLSRRRDILGDKRVQVTLLLDEEATVRNHDLSYTEKTFQGQTRQQNPPNSKSLPPQDKKRTIQTQQNFGYIQNPYQQPQIQQQMYSPYGVYQPNPYPLYPNPNEPLQKNPQIQRQSIDRHSNQHSSQERQYAQKRYQLPSHSPVNQPIERKKQVYQDPMSLINSLIVPSNNDKKGKDDLPPVINIKKPQNRKDSEIDASDIINKMLGIDSNRGKETKQKTMQPVVKSKYEGEQKDLHKDSDQEGYHKRDQDPTWSGFLTWSASKRVGVDGYHAQNGQCKFNDYNVNITGTISFQDMYVKQKLNSMVIEPQNSIYEATFKEYRIMLQDRVGVSANAQYVIYVLGKSVKSDQIAKINDQELLMVMEKKNSAYLYIKDKITPIQTEEDRKKKLK